MKKIVTLVVLMIVSILLAGSTWFINFKYIQEEQPTGCLEKTVETKIAATAFAKRMQGLLDHSSEVLGSVGLQATVVKADGEIWTGVSGLANHDEQCPVSPHSLFFIGSATKIFTAALAMSLVEERLLKLEDAASKWITQADIHPGVTVKHLLSHTSGLPSYTDDLAFKVQLFLQPDRRWYPRELLEIIERKKLKSKPGSRYEYSNSNYMLLGLVVEEVMKKKFRDLVEERIINPLDLDSTLIFPDFSQSTRIVHGYDETLLKLGRIDMGAFQISLQTTAFAAGAMVSNSENVARFTKALFQGEVVSKRSLAAMTSFLDVDDADIPTATGYGLGLRRLEVDGRELWGHTGIFPGFTAITMYSPVHGYVVAILGNLSVLEAPIILGEFQRAILSPQKAGGDEE